MVMSIGKMKEGNYAYVKEEVQRVHAICRKHNKLLKVIIEIYPLSVES